MGETEVSADEQVPPWGFDLLRDEVDAWREAAEKRDREVSLTETALQRRRDGQRGRARKNNLRRLYGITPEEYDALRVAQGYRCAICDRPEAELPDRQTGRPRLDGKPNAAPMRLHVDHDHDTDAIRGLLCWPCNTAIGLFQDQPFRMTRAIAYVTAGGVQT